METKSPLKDQIIDRLLTKVIRFEKEIINDKRLSSNSNLAKLKEIIEDEVNNDVD